MSETEETRVMDRKQVAECFSKLDSHTVDEWEAIISTLEDNGSKPIKGYSDTYNRFISDALDLVYDPLERVRELRTNRDIQGITPKEKLIRQDRRSIGLDPVEIDPTVTRNYFIQPFLLAYSRITGK